MNTRRISRSTWLFWIRTLNIVTKKWTLPCWFKNETWLNLSLRYVKEAVDSSIPYYLFDLWGTVYDELLPRWGLNFGHKLEGKFLPKCGNSPRFVCRRLWQSYWYFVLPIGKIEIIKIIELIADQCRSWDLPRKFFPYRFFLAVSFAFIYL